MIKLGSDTNFNSVNLQIGQEIALLSILVKVRKMLKQILL